VLQLESQAFGCTGFKKLSLFQDGIYYYIVTGSHWDILHQSRPVGYDACYYNPPEEICLVSAFSGSDALLFAKPLL
jgi:hypothetical protein